MHRSALTWSNIEARTNSVFAALLGRKISDGSGVTTSSEDLLTSEVFGTFSYLDCLDIPAAFLSKARNIFGGQFSIENLSRLRIVFWPTVRYGKSEMREPDAVLLLDFKDGQKAFALVEAKYLSGPSNRMFSGESASKDPKDTTSNLDVMLGHQLADEYIAIRQGTWSTELAKELGEATRKILLYVTAHHDFPLDDFTAGRDEIIHPAKGVSGLDIEKDFARDFYWLSWQDLHGILDEQLRADFPNYTPGQKKLLLDLMRALALRNLTECRGISPLPPCGDYEEFFDTMLWESSLQVPETYSTIWHAE